MTGRLIHYSNTHLTGVYSCSQYEGRSLKRGDKPNGLWVSVEGEQDWREWCEAESFGCLDCATEVVLRPDAKMLRIETPEALKAFHDEYHCPPKWTMNLNEDWDDHAIAWLLVAEKYQGIIIAPYQWSWRLTDPISHWYYGWDCASGVIWDAGAVAEVRPIERKKEAADEKAA